MDINAIWDAIAPYVTGTGIGAIIGGILFACLKGAFARAINRVDVEKIADKTVDRAMDKIKSVSFSQNIQPIVEDELKKVLAVLNENLNNTIGQTEKDYSALLDVLVCLTQYFENGVGIPEGVKQNLAEAIEKAKKQLKEEPKIGYSVTLNEENKVVVEQEETKVVGNVR